MTILRLLLMAAAVLAVVVGLPAGIVVFAPDRSLTRDGGGAVASTEPASPAAETDAAALDGGTPCRKLTRTIDIGGEIVPASALLCREGDGTWQLDGAQIAQRVAMPASDVADNNEPPVWMARAAPKGRNCIRGGLPCGTRAAAPRAKAIAARPHDRWEAAIDRPNR